jgi:hypothetical protein
VLSTRLRLSWVLLVPQPALVARPRTKVPSFDEQSLGGIDVVLVFNLLDADFQAVLGEDDVLGLHFLRGALGDLEKAKIDVVAYEGGTEEHNKEDDEGESLSKYEKGESANDVGWVRVRGTDTKADLGGGGGFGMDERPQAMIAMF